MLTALAVASFGMSFAQGAFGASAARKSARASMAALQSEKAWNLGVMERSKEDRYASDLLSAYGSGISSATGSTRAIIENNQQVMQDEINFRRQQYDIQLKNLEAQSKQKFLGLF